MMMLKKFMQGLFLVVVCFGLLACQVFAGSVTGPNYNPAAVVIRGGTINGAVIGGTTPAAGTFTTMNSATIQSGGRMLVSSSAPTIFSGFGSSPSIVAHNGPAAFSVNVGGGGAVSSGRIRLPSAATGWVCNVANALTAANQVTAQNGFLISTTDVELQSYNVSAGTASNWAAGRILYVSCFPY